MTTIYMNFATGNDASNGLTPETAWKNISKLTAALAVTNTISHVIFDSGKPFLADSYLQIPAGVNGGNGITLTGSPGKAIVCFARDLSAATWALTSGATNVYQTQLPTSNSVHKNAMVWEVIAGDLLTKKRYECKFAASYSTGLRNTLDAQEGSYWVDNASGILYVHKIGGGNPTAAALCWAPWYMLPVYGYDWWQNTTGGLILGTPSFDNESNPIWARVESVTISNMAFSGIGGVNPTTGAEDSAASWTGGGAATSLLFSNVDFYDGTNHQFGMTDPTNAACTLTFSNCKVGQGALITCGWVFAPSPGATVTFIGCSQPTPFSALRSLAGNNTNADGVTGGGFVGSHWTGTHYQAESFEFIGCNAPYGEISIADPIAVTLGITDSVFFVAQLGFDSALDGMQINVTSSNFSGFSQYTATVGGSGSLTVRGCILFLQTDGSTPLPGGTASMSGNLFFYNNFIFTGFFNYTLASGFFTSAGALASKAVNLTWINNAVRANWDGYPLWGNLRADEIVNWDYHAEENNYGAGSFPILINAFDGTNSGAATISSAKLSDMITWAASHQPASFAHTYSRQRVNFTDPSTAANCLFYDPQKTVLHPQRSDSPSLKPYPESTALIGTAKRLGFQPDFSGQYSDTFNIGPWQTPVIQFTTAAATTSINDEGGTLGVSQLINGPASFEADGVLVQVGPSGSTVTLA